MGGGIHSPWLNFKPGTIWNADNLDVMRGMNSETIDLIYLDPPFNSDAEYSASNSFNDIWTKENLTKWSMLNGIEASVEILQENPWWEFLDVLKDKHSERLYYYLSFMGIRIVQMYDILKPTGSLYLHCDDTTNSYLRMVLDFVFGYKNGPGKNRSGAQITWKRAQAKNTAKRIYSRDTDNIYLYHKTKHYTHNPQYIPLDKEYIEKTYVFDDGDGRGKYLSQSLVAPSRNSNKFYFKGFPPPEKGWRHTPETMRRLDNDNKLIYPSKPHGRIRKKLYLSESKGKLVSNIWTDIGKMEGQDRKSKNWETQKPPKLLERVIETSSNPGDLVFDPFAGCGSTLVAAIKTGRRFVGCDIDETLVCDTMKKWFTDTKDNYLDDLLRETEYIVSTSPPSATRKQLKFDFSGSNIKLIRDRNLRRKYGPDLYMKAHGRCQGKSCSKKDQNFMPFDMLEIDHKQPLSCGGSNDLRNLQLLCRNCNAKKSDRCE